MPSKSKALRVLSRSAVLCLPPKRMRSTGVTLSTVGLFAGIGGIELGLSKAGHETRSLCELDPGARRVLGERFTCRLDSDIRSIRALPRADLVTAGFPCQDLSQAGRTAGIEGVQSSLVAEVFARLGTKRTGPKWLLLENVPFMLHLQRGKAMRYLVDQLEDLGFTWAYRIVDSRAFGIPQRRKRVLLLASRTEDPRSVLLGSDAGEVQRPFNGSELCGFYWTEGSRGLGWAVDAIPTLKGGSSIGIPSPPAIWDPLDRSIGTPDIRDAERLQGFDADWTEPASRADGVRPSHRWKLVGNAVSVPVAEWVGQRLRTPEGESPEGVLLSRGVSWPAAAWGHRGKVFSVDVSSFPVKAAAVSLRQFLRHPLKPLSHKAASGFESRAIPSGLWFEEGFLADINRHIKRMADLERAQSAARRKYSSHDA
jgi:DNA (cytosine-5)-methyltransferase 1